MSLKLALKDSVRSSDDTLSVDSWEDDYQNGGLSDEDTETNCGIISEKITSGLLGSQKKELSDYGIGISEGQNQNIAAELKSLLTVDHCYICYRSASINNHYTTKKHVIKVLSWIKGNAIRFNFDIKNIISLYCEACNDVFESVGVSLLHYISDKHNENKINYCETCKKHVLDIDKHRSTNSHISTSEQKISSKGSSVVIIAKKLKKLLNSCYCGICQISVNFRMIDHHYMQREHTLSVRKWLDDQLRKAQVNFQYKVLIYCEACSMNLDGTNKALKHYYMASHLDNKKAYCPICVLRGTPVDLEKHNLSAHSNVCSSEVLSKDLVHEISTLENRLDSIKLQPYEGHSDYGLRSHVQKWIDGTSNIMKCSYASSAEVVEEKKCELPDANKTEYDHDKESLKNKILEELNEIMDKVYSSRMLSYEDVLVRLRDLNAVLTVLFGKILSEDNIFANNTVNKVFSECSIQNMPENHSKQKLAMEIRRVKLVLTNHNRINVETSFQYIHNLNQLVQDLISNRIEFFDIVSIFEIDYKSNLSCVEWKGSEEALQEELKKLEDCLMDGNKLKVDVALDCVTQFNIQLEKLLFSQ